VEVIKESFVGSLYGLGKGDGSKVDVNVGFTVDDSAIGVGVGD
jgi:hypothetical protein